MCLFPLVVLKSVAGVRTFNQLTIQFPRTLFIPSCPYDYHVDTVIYSRNIIPFQLHLISIRCLTGRITTYFDPRRDSRVVRPLFCLQNQTLYLGQSTTIGKLSTISPSNWEMLELKMASSARQGSPLATSRGVRDARIACSQSVDTLEQKNVTYKPRYHIYSIP